MHCDWCGPFFQSLTTEIHSPSVTKSWSMLSILPVLLPLLMLLLHLLVLLHDSLPSQVVFSSNDIHRYCGFCRFSRLVIFTTTPGRLSGAPFDLILRCFASHGDTTGRDEVSIKVSAMRGFRLNMSHWLTVMHCCLMLVDWFNYKKVGHSRLRILRSESNSNTIHGSVHPTNLFMPEWQEVHEKFRHIQTNHLHTQSLFDARWLVGQKLPLNS